MWISTSIESTNKTKNLHRISEKGRKYKANPPAEIEAEEGTATSPVTKTVIETVIETVTKTVLPQPPTPEEKETEVEPAIPSQSDIFRSVAEQLSIAKAKDGTPPQRHNQLCREDGRPGRLEFLVECLPSLLINNLCVESATNEQYLERGLET